MPVLRLKSEPGTCGGIAPHAIRLPHPPANIHHRPRVMAGRWGKGVPLAGRQEQGCHGREMDGGHQAIGETSKTELQGKMLGVSVRLGNLFINVFGLIVMTSIERVDVFCLA